MIAGEHAIATATERAGGGDLVVVALVDAFLVVSKAAKRSGLGNGEEDVELLKERAAGSL